MYNLGSRSPRSGRAGCAVNAIVVVVVVAVVVPAMMRQETNKYKHRHEVRKPMRRGRALVNDLYDVVL